MHVYMYIYKYEYMQNIIKHNDELHGTKEHTSYASHTFYSRKG